VVSLATLFDAVAVIVKVVPLFSCKLEALRDKVIDFPSSESDSIAE